MKPSKRVIHLSILLGVTALALAIAIFYFWQRDLPQLVKQGGSESPRQTEKSAASYEITYSSGGNAIGAALLTPGKTPSDDEKIKISSVARLKLHVSEPKVDGINILYNAQFDPLDIAMTGNGQSMLTQAQIDQLKDANFHFVYDPTGRLLEVRTDESLPFLIKSLVYDIVSRSQIVGFIESKENEKSWETVENDRSGSYTSIYKMTSDTITKSKRAYTTKNRSQIEILQCQISAVEFKGTWNFEKLLFAERIRYKAAEHDLGDSDITMELQRISSEKSLIIVTDVKGAVPIKPPSSDEQKRNRSANVLGKRTLDELFEQFSQIADNPSVDKAHLQRALVAWIYLNPKDLDRLSPHIANLPYDDFLFQSIIVGLTESNHPEAQQMLVKSAEHAANDLKKSRVIYVGMGSITLPAPQVIEYLASTYQAAKEQDLRELSGLTFAAVLRRAPAEIDIQEFKAKLTSDLESAKNAEELIFQMRIAGNLGSSDSLPFLLKMTQEGPALQRSTALRSMRFIQDGRVDEIYEKTLRDLTDPQLHNAVLLSLTLRESSEKMLFAVRDVIYTPTDITNKIAAIDLLWKSRTVFPWILDVRDALVNDTKQNSRVRAYARNLSQ